MIDEAFLNVIRAADPEDPEDLQLRFSLAVALRGFDEPVFGPRHDREDCRVA